MLKPPDYIHKIQPYIPGKPIEELERETGIKDSIKLASNENPQGTSPLALKAILNFLTKSKTNNSLNRYPDGSGYYLKKSLSNFLNVREEEIILGNGSNELIDIAVRTFMQNGDEAIMADPSFIVYPMSVQSIGGEKIMIPLKNYTHDLEAMADAVTDKTKIIFIANPNNPTGTINRKKEFDAFIKKIPENILIIIDEAYYEYVTDPDFADSMRHLREGKNILILRTFSKIYGLAGLRIGYGISKPEILNEMNKLRPPFNTNILAQIAAKHALEDTDFIRTTIEINEMGKNYLYKELREMDIEFVPTHANFIYICLKHDSKIFYNKLLMKGIIVRPVGPKEIRVTIGLPDENRRFIEAFKSILNSLN